MIKGYAKDQIREVYEESNKSLTYFEWVELESKNDPGFFYHLFDGDYETDFDGRFESLTEEQKEEFAAYMNRIKELSRLSECVLGESNGYRYVDNAGDGIIGQGELPEFREELAENIRAGRYEYITKEGAAEVSEWLAEEYGNDADEVQTIRVWGDDMPYTYIALWW